MTRAPLRFTPLPEVVACPDCGADCAPGQIHHCPYRGAVIAPGPRSPAPRTPEDGQRIHTPEGGKPITTRKD